MKKSLIALAVLASLAGCAGTFGHSTLSVKANAVKGCDLEVKDGTEFKARSIEFDGKKCTLTVDEDERKAFKGQGIGVTLNPLPTMGLDTILAP